MQIFWMNVRKCSLQWWACVFAADDGGISMSCYIQRWVSQQSRIIIAPHKKPANMTQVSHNGNSL